MAKNRRNQSAAIRFGPAIKALLLCMFIAGSGIGYVWQKKQIMELSQQIGRLEFQLDKLKKDNELRRRQLDELHLPGNLERRARELNLGLVPARATQVVRLPEPQTDTPPPTRPQNIYPASQARLAPHDLPPPSVGVSAGGTGPTGARRTNGLNM